MVPGIPASVMVGDSGLVIDRAGGLQGPRPAGAIEAEIRKDWSGKRGFCGAKMHPKVKARDRPGGRASAYKLRGSGGKAGLEEQAFQVFV
jgi:hypothetical protein